MSSAQFAVSRYYFSIFMGGGVISIYLPIWLNARGVTDTQIGYLNAAPMLGILLISVLVGRIADRASDWKQTIVIGQVLAAIFTIALGLATEFWVLLIIWTLSFVPAGVVMPVADAATIRLGLRRGFSFGAVRAWGTVGYLLICILAGWIISIGGPGIFLWLLGGLAILRAAMAYLLPPMRESGQLITASPGLMLSANLRAALRPWILLPMIGSALLFAAHLVLNGFAALVWLEQGISESTIGILVAIGASAEAGTMFIWKSLQRRFSARHLILIAALVAVFRWTAMAFAPPLWALLPLQVLHGVTFTFGYLGCMYFIANRTDESVAAEAQGLFSMMQQTVAVVALASFGALFQAFGDLAFLGCSLLSIMTAILIVASLMLQRTAGDD